ncbi:MAG: undecaprenyl-diphosphatase [Proteobacteria bacterium]|nr:MAG: undecaprenyl-diphosphatase [Pseudomonadota bacterium]PIE40417.1 MAG: undecaprenyl-diphosphatase [Gammaproteobacteria bacterium]
MDLIQLIVLAVIQGLTEFLPVSSSAHLILPAQVLGWQDQGLAFDVAVHVGTLFAVMLYFRQDITGLLKSWCVSLVPGKVHGEEQGALEARLAWFIIIATIPAGLAGLMLGDVIEAHLRSTLVIAVATVFFGVMLGFADRRHNERKGIWQVTLLETLIVGCAQALALIPGTSRSGITMTAALALGWSRDAAARFSFLLSIPLILAAGGLKTKELMEAGGATQWGDIALGAALSFVSAFCCIHLFLKFLQKIGFMPFVYYRIVLGLVLFGFLMFGGGL